MLKTCLKYFWILLFYLPLAAQNDSLFIKWAELMEEDPVLMENLQQLLEQPVNLNSATKEALLSIPFLSPEQADNIIAERNKGGLFRTKRAIRKIVGKEYYELIKNLITTRTQTRKMNLLQNRSKLNIENIELGQLNGYQGDAWSIYNKIYIRPSKNFRGGFITQKDAGEAFYLDFITGYGEYAAESWRMIAGSYYLHFGQGLVFSSPFGQRKSSAAMAAFVPLNGGGYATLSSSENTGNLGLFLKFLPHPNFNIHLFYADNKRDAGYDAVNNRISGIRYDGYHRTISEIAAKDRLEEKLAGIVLQAILLSGFELGVLWARHSYHPDIEPYLPNDGESLRRGYYKFSGNEINQSAVFYRAGLSSLSLEGEAAFSGWQKNQTAICQSVSVKEENIGFGIKYWRLGEGYQSPSGRVFDDADPFPRAREGWYAAILLKGSEALTMNLYRLLHKELWRGYFANLPVNKQEWLAELEWKQPNLNLQIRYRLSTGEEIRSPSDAAAGLVDLDKRAWRIQTSYSFTGKTRILTRWEQVEIKNEGQRGVNIFQEIQWAGLKQLRLNFRYSYFRTAGYDSRVYEYETDFPGAFANYALYGEGNKWYALLRYTPLPSFDIRFKYRYMSRRDLTASQTEIYRNAVRLHRSVQFMLQWRF